MREPVIDLLETGGRVAGIDPGANTGIVCVAFDASLDWNHAAWVGSAVVHPSTSTKLTPPARDYELAVRIGTVLSGWLPAHTVLEEPLDATARWAYADRKNRRGQTMTGEREGRHTGTDFRLGAYYGIAAMAAGMAGGRWIDSYPVRRYGKRAGWQEGGSRDRVLATVRQTMRAIGAPADGVSEHEMMALGVVLYHVGQIREARMAAKIAAVRRGA